MFCLVELMPPRPPEEIKRRGLFRRKTVITPREPLFPQRVCIGGYPAFFIFRVPCDELLSEETKAVFNAYRGRLIFQQCMNVPAELSEYVYVPSEYERVILLKRAELILHDLFYGKDATSLLICDVRGRSLRASLPLVAFTKDVYVSTLSEDCFDAFSERAFSGYGAIVYRFRGEKGSEESFSALRSERDSGFSGSAVLDYNAALLKVTVPSRLGLRTDTYAPPYPPLPDELSEALPAGISRELFICAMYDICRFRFENGFFA